MLEVNSNNVTTTSSQGLETKEIQLKDDTVLNPILNGTEFEYQGALKDSVLSEDNLSEVTIDGEVKGKMILISKYSFGAITRFSLREQTAEEKIIESQAQQVTQLQLALAEVYELLLVQEV